MSKEPIPDDWANTFELTHCETCGKFTFVFMGKDGQRWCPVCKEKKEKE